MLSCADAIAGVLERHLNATANSGNGHDGGSGNKANHEEKSVETGPIKNIAGQCPDCGGILRYQEGCFICPACGYTKC